MSRLGAVGNFSTSKAMCYPSAPKLECNLCSRRRTGYLPEPEIRVEVVIDASAVFQKGTCALWSGVPVVRPRCEVEAA